MGENTQRAATSCELLGIASSHTKSGHLGIAKWRGTPYGRLGGYTHELELSLQLPLRCESCAIGPRSHKHSSIARKHSTAQSFGKITAEVSQSKSTIINNLKAGEHQQHLSGRP